MVTQNDPSSSQNIHYQIYLDLIKVAPRILDEMHWLGVEGSQIISTKVLGHLSYQYLTDILIIIGSWKPVIGAPAVKTSIQ